MKFSFTCTCGDKTAVEAASREEAVEKIKGMMTEDAVKAHFAEKHPGDPLPPMDGIVAQIEAGVVEEPA